MISTADLFFRLQEHPDAAQILDRVVRIDERIRRKHGELAKLQVKNATRTVQPQELIDILDELSDELTQLEDERQSVIQASLGYSAGE